VTPRPKPKGPVDSTRVPEIHLRVDSSLVLIPVQVTTPGGTSVTSLSQDNFELFEEGVEQKITHFSQEDGPISVGLLFDSSGSMRNKVLQSSEAAAAFLRTANSDDEFFLVEFGDRPKLAVPFTSDADAIFRRILHNKPLGRTSLLDAILMSLVEMKHARNTRKAIVILSDGGDNSSHYTPRQIRNALLESDLQVYAIGIFDRNPPHRQPEEERNGPQLLDDLAEQTGGRLYPIENLDDLGYTSARISRDLRSQYVLGYSPSNQTRDAKYRRVRLKVISPEGTPSLRTYYRRGYYAPSE
jgi:Ca-activated chloride channel family protein